MILKIESPIRSYLSYPHALLDKTNAVVSGFWVNFSILLSHFIVQKSFFLGLLAGIFNYLNDLSLSQVVFGFKLAAFIRFYSFISLSVVIFVNHSDFG